MHIYINIYCERQRECHKNKKLIHDTSTKHPQGQIIIYIQWAQTKLVHMTLGNTNVLCTSLVCAHCIHGMEWNGMEWWLCYYIFLRKVIIMNSKESVSKIPSEYLQHQLNMPQATCATVQLDPSVKVKLTHNMMWPGYSSVGTQSSAPLVSSSSLTYAAVSSIIHTLIICPATGWRNFIVTVRLLLVIVSDVSTNTSQIRKTRP